MVLAIHNGRLGVLSFPGKGCHGNASGANFQRWKSRFARSSGYVPERDGRIAPPLKPETKPAPCEDVVQPDPAAAGAACQTRETDAETRRRGDAGNALLSPRLPVSASPRL
jgi:hypothetical protein